MTGDDPHKERIARNQPQRVGNVSERLAAFSSAAAFPELTFLCLSLSSTIAYFTDIPVSVTLVYSCISTTLHSLKSGEP